MIYLIYGFFPRRLHINHLTGRGDRAGRPYRPHPPVGATFMVALTDPPHTPRSSDVSRPGFASPSTTDFNGTYGTTRKNIFFRDLRASVVHLFGSVVLFFIPLRFLRDLRASVVKNYPPSTSKSYVISAVPRSVADTEQYFPSESSIAWAAAFSVNPAPDNL